MPALLGFLFIVLCLQVAEFSEPAACVIELQCEECVPDNMPAVVSHGARDGAVRAPHGDEVTLSCGGGHFLAYPLRAALTAACEAGRYRVRHDGTLRHLLDLGCQENVFEDVLHPVEHCSPPLQGRAYVTQEEGGTRHLATACFDADRAVAVRLRATAALPPHSDARSPLSLLGNFNHMFDAATRHDAERLFSDDARLTRRLRERLRHERFSFAAQGLTSGALLAAGYFPDRDMRAADFASNRVAVWRSVADGNLRHLQADVARLVRRDRARARLDLYAGTHAVLALDDSQELFLKAGRRFPVPKYIWTVLHDRRENRGVAIVLLNDPFVRVSDIRAAVFCESACGAVGWLEDLQRHRNYERPIEGLVFCCALPDFVDVVAEMPRVFNSSIRLLSTY